MAKGVFDRAYSLHLRACRPYDAPRVRGLTYPFGRPVGMPDHEWRVSWDIMQALTEAAPPPDPIPNPKTSSADVRLLFGWPLRVDRRAVPGTLELVQVTLA